MKKFTVREMAEVGVLAAIVFVATYFLKIGPIPTPAGPTMLKTGNAICLLGGILFGKTKGGIAAGIGSMLYDLTDPAFAPSAPFTFAFFFAMAFICGAVSHSGGKNGNDRKRNFIGAFSGAFSYVLLTVAKSFITLTLGGSGIAAALASCGTKALVSSVNAVFAIAVAVILAPVFQKALNKRYN